MDENRIADDMDAQLPDGSWQETDYRSTTAGFPAMAHLTKLKEMAVAYANDKSKLYHNQQLKEKLLSGYEYFYKKRPKSLNWWYNDIGAPEIYMIGLLLLRDNMPDSLLYRYSGYLKDATGNQSHLGRNLVWVSAITIYKGCIENNPALVSKGFTAIASTLTIAREQGREGIKKDFSFHQHRAQLYSGGYGLSFAEEMADWISLAEGTIFSKAFSEESRKLFVDLMLNGHQLFGYKNVMDFGSLGRNISRPNNAANVHPLTLDKMATIAAVKAEDFHLWKAHIQGTAFPGNFQGNKHFWKSDMMTQHGPNFYLSAKIISTRTVGTEMLNGENLKGYYLPLGATNIMTSGEEYKNIFPVWDWTRVPGTTTVMNQSTTILPWYLYGSNVFGGGISNGMNGLIAYQHSYNGVQARKAYFFLGNTLICLGADINAYQPHAVVTSVNQCFSKGDVFVKTTHGNALTRMNDSLLTTTDLKWIYHDRIGYVLPKGGKITLKNAIQSGSWKIINENGDSSKISKKIFSAWIEHGKQPDQATYAYMVVPDKSLNDFQSWFSEESQNYELLRNDTSLQAVGYSPERLYAAVFYRSGTLNIGDGWSITADGPVLLLLKEKKEGLEISVSDPLYKNSKRKLVVNKHLSGNGAIYKHGVTEINFVFPKGDDTGKTIGTTFAVH